MFLVTVNQLTEKTTYSTEHLLLYLWGVSFDWWTALCATVQGKMNERLNLWQGHLVDNISIALFNLAFCNHHKNNKTIKIC